MRCVVVLVLCVVWVFGLSRDEAIEQALKLEIYTQKQWRDLLHFDGRESEIDSPEFFYAKNGKKDAKAELIATIEAFYQPIDSIIVPEDFIERVSKSNALLDAAVTSLPRRSSSPEDYHGICRFPARFFYLDSLLHFEGLPTLECQEFKTMFAYVNPKSATIIFPAAHINSPASMFGHTFLLLNSGFNSRLLSFAINYQASADPNVENGFAFAFKGLFGMYDGRFSILPYYEKIKEYRDVENRDIWEFDLNLSYEEVVQMYRHIWELGDAWSWYYFFSENCSYNILWLLEVARPSLALREKFIYQVNPPETLFVMRNAGLITKETYRPSRRAKLLAYEKEMSFSDVHKAKKVAKGKLSAQNIADDENLSLRQKQYILESSIEMSEYWYAKDKLKRDDYTQIIHDSASARSRLGASRAVEVITPNSPLTGNRGLRLSPMYFANADSSGITQQGLGLDFRLTYHDITDNDRGYLTGAQIEFLRILGYAEVDSQNQMRAHIHQATILSLASFGMVSKFFTPFSYRLDTGFSRQFLHNNLRYYFALGGGFSTRIGQYSYVYYLLEPTLYFDWRNQGRFLLSNAFGVVLGNDGALKLALEYKLKAYDTETFGHYVSATGSINLKANLGLFLTLESNLLPQPYISRYGLQSGLRIYF
ncbi:DUF4105 domain-containing protein [uncultured Helicobacter sp.]|uniref:Lnb N-terminal periplasmic domain-containing protein n=1 Tax=uncultured Helicobacter sp. TaxID=175537 RepID=UPI00374F254E